MNVLLLCFPCFGRYREDDPERQSLFPPPNTVLTPPRPCHRLPPLDPSGPSSNYSSGQVSPTSTAGWGVSRDWSSSGLDNGSRERIGSISRAYQGRMLPITHRSQPSSNTSSAITTPHHTRLQFIDPHRPAAPEIGRSVSEPRSLLVLAGTSNTGLPDFAPHQVPPGHTAGDTLSHRRRSSTSMDLMSALYPRRMLSPEEVARGRSPGPNRLGRSASMDLLSTLGGSRDDLPDESPGAVSEPDGNVEVTRRLLGLNELSGMNFRRGSRGRSRPGRGKDIRRVTS